MTKAKKVELLSFVRHELKKSSISLQRVNKSLPKYINFLHELTSESSKKSKLIKQKSTLKAASELDIQSLVVQLKHLLYSIDRLAQLRQLIPESTKEMF